MLLNGFMNQRREIEPRMDLKPLSVRSDEAAGEELLFWRRRSGLSALSRCLVAFDPL